MAFGVTLEIEGQDQVGAVFGRVAQAFEDMTPFMEIVRDWFYDLEQDAFDSEGADIGQEWPALGALTKDPPGRYGRWKEQHYPGRPLLVLHGVLKDAVTGVGSESWHEIDKQSLKIGVSLPYWRAHLHGREEVNIPARVFSFIDDDHMRDLNGRIQEKLNELNDELNRLAGAGYASGIAR